MIGIILYAASIGVIGLVSYLWLSNYVDLDLKKLWNNRKKGSSGSGSGSSKPPELPKRPAELEAKREQHKKGQTQPAAAAASASSSASATAHRPSVNSNLLSMAMNSPPALPKRPMLNILHAPTLTKSFSPSPHNGPSGIASPPSPSPTPANQTSEEKMAAHREQVQWELVSSEEKYISCLNILMNVYFHPLKTKADKGSAKLSQSDFALLFSNVESISNFHHLLLPSLKTAADGNVAAVIQSHAPYLKLYTKFCNDYPVMLQTMSKLNRNPDFTRFLKKQRDSPVSEGLDIMSYLITPVQRVPRYLLLLRELQRYTPKSHPHSDSIEAAIATVSKIAIHINEQQRHHENASLLLEFQHQIHNLTDEIQLLQPHRRLMRHGILTLVKQEGTATAALKSNEIGKNFVCILFNDLVLYTTEDHDYRGMLKLPGCQLNVDNLLIEIIKPKTDSHRVQMSLRFECPSLEEANKWSESIRESIQLADELTQKDERRRSAASNSISITR